MLRQFNHKTQINDECLTKKIHTYIQKIFQILKYNVFDDQTRDALKGG